MLGRGPYTQAKLTQQPDRDQAGIVSEKVVDLYNLLHVGFAVSLAIFTWVFWLSRDGSFEKGDSNIKALHVLWWVLLGLDLAYFAYNILNTFCHPVCGKTMEVLNIGREGVVSNHLANAARLAVSMTVAVGIYTDWKDYFALDKAHQTATRFAAEYSESSGVILLAAFGSILYLGALIHIIANQKSRSSA